MESSELVTDLGGMKETAPSVMKYQYDQIIKHLVLLQDHAAARTCPYSPAGEACIRKHLLTIEAYAEETIPMEVNAGFKEKLESLENEARNYRFDEEAALCGANAAYTEGLEHWARKWRKEFELHALPCQLEKPAAGQERPAEQPEPERQPAMPGA